MGLPVTMGLLGSGLSHLHLKSDEEELRRPKYMCRLTLLMTGKDFLPIRSNIGALATPPKS